MLSLAFGFKALGGFSGCDGDSSAPADDDGTSEADVTSDIGDTSDSDVDGPGDIGGDVETADTEPGGDDGTSDTGGTSELTWSGREIPAPGVDDWSSVFATADDAIWVAGRGALFEYDGSDWTMLGSHDQFGFVPAEGNMEVAWDAMFVVGLSSTEIYTVSGNALVAKYDGSTFTKIINGFAPPEMFAQQPSMFLGTSWISPTGSIHYILSGQGDHDYAVWDGTTRSSSKLNTKVGNLDYPIGVIWGIDDDNIWAGGNTTNPFDSPIHRWNGTAWVRSTYTFADNGKIVGFWGATPDDVWMATTGGLGGRLFRNTGDGWTAVSHGPGEGSGLVYNHIWGSSNDNLFVASNQGLFRYDGSEWAKVDIGSDEAVLHIHPVSATKLVLTVGNAAKMGLRYVEAD